jgi:hypothetical protein
MSAVIPEKTLVVEIFKYRRDNTKSEFSMMLLKGYQAPLRHITFLFVTYKKEYHISPSLFKRGIFRHRRMRLWLKGESREVSH